MYHPPCRPVALIACFLVRVFCVADKAREDKEGLDLPLAAVAEVSLQVPNGRTATPFPLPLWVKRVSFESRCQCCQTRYKKGDLIWFVWFFFRKGQIREQRERILLAAIKRCIPSYGKVLEILEKEHAYVRTRRSPGPSGAFFFMFQIESTNHPPSCVAFTISHSWMMAVNGVAWARFAVYKQRTGSPPRAPARICEQAHVAVRGAGARLGL